MHLYTFLIRLSILILKFAFNIQEDIKVKEKYFKIKLKINKNNYK